MKKTRNLFVLKSRRKELVPKALQSLQFKGMVYLPSDVLSESAIQTAFFNNKSVLCTEISPDLELKYKAIVVRLVDFSDTYDCDTKINTSKDIAKQFESIAEQHNCDIGDHVSNSSGLNGAPRQTDCAYCQYLIDPRNEIGYPNNQMIYQNENFFAFTTLGQFVLPYLLIIPNEHVVSYAELTDSQRQDFLDVLDDIEFILKATYHVDNFLVFENGTGHGALGKAKDSVVHAHIHVVASQYTADDIERISGFPMTKTCLEDLSSYGKYSYLLLRGKNNRDWRINDNPALYIPRQYIRQILAEEHGINGHNQWNWRNFPFPEKRKQATEDIYKMLTENWEKLPDRIRQNTQVLLSTF